MCTECRAQNLVRSEEVVSLPYDRFSPTGSTFEHPEIARKKGLKFNYCSPGFLFLFNGLKFENTISQHEVGLSWSLLRHLHCVSFHSQSQFMTTQIKGLNSFQIRSPRCTHDESSTSMILQVNDLELLHIFIS